MLLPYANALVEIIFNTLKLTKTDNRNSLERESIVRLLHGREGMALLGTSADELNLED